MFPHGDHDKREFHMSPGKSLGRGNSNLLMGKFLQGYGNYPGCVGYLCNSITVVNARPPSYIDFPCRFSSKS